MAKRDWMKRARRIRRELPRVVRIGLALWLAAREAFGWWRARPLALRLTAGGTVLLGAAIMLSFRWGSSARR